MAWKSFYLASSVVATVSLPFYSGSSGLEYVPNGPCIITANHSSFLDGPLLAMAYARGRLRPLHMIAYEEPFRHWLMGWVLRSGGCIPFKRGNRRSQAKMLRTALGWLAAGEAVGIFPEGHINQQDTLNRPRSGAALLALESGCPVIPSAIMGSASAFPLGTSLPRLGRRVSIRFGPPLTMLAKEEKYARLPPDERKAMVDNLGYRIMNAIGLLAGRKCKDF